MDSRQLGYFRRIVEAGTMTEAARRLGIAQPSLSQHVRNLERHLGAELLVRTARGVVATEAGRTLYEHAVEITDRMAQAEAAIRSSGGEPSGPVRLGLPASVSMALSVPLAETARVALPQLRLCAVEAMSGHIKAWLAAGEVDLAVLYDLDGLRAGEARLLLHEDLHVYAAPDTWPFATPPGMPVPLAALAELELILPSAHHGLRMLIDRVARQAGLAPNVVVEMDALAQIKALVARGSGYTILSPAAVHDAVAAGALVGAQLARPAIRRPVYLLRSPCRPPNAASLALEALCHEVIADLVGRGVWQADLAPAQTPKR